MNKKDKTKVFKNLKEIINIINKTAPTEIRVGDAGTNLSIKKVIEDVENRTVTVLWEDGKVTRSTADPEDNFDFNVGFGLCIAKRLTDNIGRYAEVLRKTGRFVSADDERHDKKQAREIKKKINNEREKNSGELPR